jgi:hypothetical protein
MTTKVTIERVKSSNLERMLAAAMMVPHRDPSDPACIWGLPLNIVGEPGGGKSERVLEAARMVQLAAFPVFPSTKQPEDFSGALFPSPDGPILTCILPQANKLLNLGKGVLFIDEVSTARPAVQASLLSVVNDRRVGDQLLPPAVRIMLAMNPADYAAGGYGLEAPLANRMAHISYVLPTASEWSDWLMDVPSGDDIPNITSADNLIRKNWMSSWNTARARVAGFIQANPDLLHKRPDAGSPEAGGAWPSHRMWNWAARSVATVDALGMPKELGDTLVSGCVGKGPGRSWAEWAKNAEIPPPEELLKSWKPTKKRLDIDVMALTSATNYVTTQSTEKKKAELAGAAWKLVMTYIEGGVAHLVVRSATQLVRAGLHNANANIGADDRELIGKALFQLSEQKMVKYSGQLL